MLDSIAHVVVLDDDVSVREGLKALLSDSGYSVQCFQSAEEFLARSEERRANCIILDVSLPGLDGLQLQQLLSSQYPAMSIVFITGYGDISMSVRAMKNGATEFFSKPFDHDEILRAVHSAVTRSKQSMSAEAAIATMRQRYSRLTPREKAVLPLVASGLANKNIGFELGISEITVKAHRGSLMRKLEADSLATLIQIAIALRLINDTVTSYKE
jgi:FixJ family two-component response regulator